MAKRIEVDSVLFEKNHEDAFWFESGTNAARVTDTKTGRYVDIDVHGEKSVTFQDNEETYKNGSAVEEAQRRKFTDKDIQDESKVGWNNNSWFSFELFDNTGKMLSPDDGFDVEYNIKDAIQKAKKILKEK